jgi:hypothetical protein
MAVRAADRMGYLCDIRPRDGGPTTLIHMDGQLDMDGHRGTAPLEHATHQSFTLIHNFLFKGW